MIAIEFRRENIHGKSIYKKVAFTPTTSEDADFLEHIVNIVEHQNNINSIKDQMRRKGYETK